MDLKSSNILLTSHGVAKLADVGFARVQVGQPGCFWLPAWPGAAPDQLCSAASSARMLIRSVVLPCPARHAEQDLPVGHDGPRGHLCVVGFSRMGWGGELKMLIGCFW